MKLHDLKPAPGSRTPRTRVGRGIAAGKGKTAGRGTKGQKARAGGSIPPWFEGGQTPLHMRIPKLRGFKNRLKIEYEIVNVGRIGELAALGAFEAAEAPDAKKSAKTAPVTVNQELLRAVGLVRTLDKPMKVLGQGDLEVGLFVVADAFSKSAIAKIEAAGGSVQVLEIPTRILPAIGLEPADDTTHRAIAGAQPTATAESKPKAKRGRASEAAPAESDTTDAAPATEATAEAEAPIAGEIAEASIAPVADAADADEPAAVADVAPKPARASKPKAAKTDSPAEAAKPKAAKAAKAGKPAKASAKASAVTKASDDDGPETAETVATTDTGSPAIEATESEPTDEMPAGEDA